MGTHAEALRVPTAVDAPERAWARALQRYFVERFGSGVRIRSLRALGDDAGDKGFGYGAPVRVRLEGAPYAELVVHTAATTGFGHDTLADRAAEILLPWETFNSLPRHVRALDVAAYDESGRIHSLGKVRDFLLVTEYAEGEPYFHDLDRMARTGHADLEDRRRVEALARYLAGIHAQKGGKPEFWARRNRDLFGHHECIAGLLDSYDPFDTEAYAPKALLLDVERRCVTWRHKLKSFAHRLCRVHGDFHPWNILFDARGDLVLLDRSRGEWGEAADDVTALAVNYLFFSLRGSGRLQAPFDDAFLRFYDTYLGATGDRQLLEVLPPFLVWRALVVASPAWYPRIDLSVRKALFRMIDRLLDLESFDPTRVGELLR